MEMAMAMAEQTRGSVKRRSDKANNDESLMDMGRLAAWLWWGNNEFMSILRYGLENKTFGIRGNCNCPASRVNRAVIGVDRLRLSWRAANGRLLASAHSRRVILDDESRMHKRVCSTTKALERGS
jgi:hypothetical protein